TSFSRPGTQSINRKGFCRARNGSAGRCRSARSSRRRSTSCRRSGGGKNGTPLPSQWRGSPLPQAPARPRFGTKPKAAPPPLREVTAAQELRIKAEARLASLMEEKLVTPNFCSICLARRRQRPNDFSSAFRLKHTKRHRTLIKRPPTKSEIGCDVFIETDR